MELRSGVVDQYYIGTKTSIPIGEEVGLISNEMRFVLVLK